jgi:two-component system OmpR family response regulator
MSIRAQIEETAHYVAHGLNGPGHAMDRAANSRVGLFLAARESYDVTIAGRLLPGT